MKLFGRGTRGAAAVAQARAAELRGELAEAAALYAQAGKLDEAARVMVMRGDAEKDPGARLQHYVQAIATAPDGHAVKNGAVTKRARLVVAMAKDAPMTATLREDIAQAARDLEAVGAAERAAEAYALVGDAEGEARAIAKTGDVERVEWVLSQQQARDRAARARREANEEVMMLEASGRRREAVVRARASGDEALRERAAAIEGRRVAGAIVRVVLRGRPMAIVLGDEVEIGRAATISIASAALSRRHVAIARKDGAVVVRDLGSRNGTTLRGLPIAGEISVGEGLDLRLGKDVMLGVRSATDWSGAVVIEIAGNRYVAPLGAAALGIGRWQLERGKDDWIELVTSDDPPPFAREIRLAPRVTLLVSDRIGSARAQDAVLEIEAPVA